MNINKIVDSVNKNVNNFSGQDDTYLANDGLLHCKKCGGKRQTQIHILGRDRVVNCICQCQADEYEREKQEKEKRARQKYIADLRQQGFNNDDIAKWTFKNDNGSNKKLMRIVKNYVDNFPQFKKEGKGLLLYGNVGTGKTYAAACVANALIDKGIPCYMTNFSRVSNALMSTYEGKEKYLNQLNSFDLLVIDDLGIERKTEYMQEVVFSVIDTRYRAGLPLIITTNLTIQEIRSPQDIATARCYSRILECCHPVEVAGSSQRNKKIMADYEQTRAILEG